jgi:hypothetical protein
MLSSRLLSRNVKVKIHKTIITIIIRHKKSRIIRLAGHAERMGQGRKLYRVLVGKIVLSLVNYSSIMNGKSKVINTQS